MGLSLPTLSFFDGNIVTLPLKGNWNDNKRDFMHKKVYIQIFLDNVMGLKI